MADITLTQSAGFGLATILPRPGHGAEAIAAALADAGTVLLPTGPAQWLAMAASGGPGWAGALAMRLAGIAHAVDQSSAYALFVLAGGDAPALLQKGLPIDMADAAFPVGHVAVSVIAHIGVICQRAAPDVFHLLCFRSYAASFSHWLEETRGALATGNHP